MAVADLVPSGSKFLRFHAAFGKIGQTVGWRPPMGLAPFVLEILDPPLPEKTLLREHIELETPSASLIYVGNLKDYSQNIKIVYTVTDLEFYEE